MGFYTLQGAPLENYLAMLKHLTEPARLSRFYPDVGAFRSALELWNPALDRRRCATLGVDEGSGLPFESAYTRLLNERTLYNTEAAAGRLTRAKERSPFFRLLLQSPLPEKFNLSLSLRSLHDSGRRAARFRAVLDRYDMSEGLLARYTVDFEHESSLWTRDMVRKEGEVHAVTEEFRSALSMACQDEAELALISLSRLKGVRLDCIIRGRLGPLYRAGSSPHFLEPLFKKAPGATLLNFPLDGVSTQRKQDLNLDPFSGLFRHTLSPKSKGALDELAKRLHYKVLKERRITLWGEGSESVSEHLKGRARYLHILKNQGEAYGTAN